MSTPMNPHRLWRRCVPLLAALIALIAMPTTASAQETPVEGDILGGACHYSFELVESAKTFSGTLACSDVGLSTALRGSYQGATAHLNSLALTAIVNYDLKIDRSYTISQTLENPDTLQQAWDELLTKMTPDAREILDKLDIIAGEVKRRGQRELQDALETQDKFKDYCAENPGADLCNFSPDTSGDANDSACPIPPQVKGWMRVCVPTVVMGNYKTGNIVVTPPFGLLIVVPTGAANSMTPVLHLAGEKGSDPGRLEVVAGGVLGLNLDVEAHDVGISGSVIGMVGSLKVNSTAGVTVGRATIPSGYIGLKIPVQLPAFVYAGSSRLKAGDRFRLLDHSTISADQGAQWRAGAAQGPGAPTEMWGGSYGGIGGFMFTGHHIPPWPSHSGAAIGSPLDPTGPGQVGAASSNPSIYGGASSGANAGGFIRVEGKAVELDGTLTADGANVFGEGGGAGAGGGISVHADELSGPVTATADGGSVCCGGTLNLGGPGGGGRMAFLAQELKGFSAFAHAYGGRDTNTEGHDTSSGGTGTIFIKARRPKAGEPREGKLIVAGAGIAEHPGDTPISDNWSVLGRDLIVSGGARVWLGKARFRNVSVSGSSAILSGPVNGAMGNGGLDEPWAGHTWRELCAGFCGGGQKLELRADKLFVDSTSRIDVSGRGGAGGPGRALPNNRAPAVGSAAGPVNGYGGSHVGRGGRCYDWFGPGGRGPCPGGKAGAMYDANARHPSRPGQGGAGLSKQAGAPGGGVLTLRVDDLNLDGRLAADGLGTNGPTREEPWLHYSLAGAGAGGSIDLQVDHLSGRGRIEANGGDVCLPDPLLFSAFHDELFGCDTTTGGGAGGGGRIAVCIRHDKTGWHGRLTADGGRYRGRPTTARGAAGTRGSTLRYKAKGQNASC